MLIAFILIMAAFPCLLIICNLVIFRSPVKAANTTIISVIIPARNEASNIRAACEAVLASEDVVLDLIVVDDHSTDATSAILAAIPDQRLRVVQTAELPLGWTGKQHACSTGASIARHDLLLFLDADVRLTPDALCRIGGFMQRQQISLSSGFPQELCGGFSDGLLLPLIHFLLLGFLPIAAMRRSTAVALGAGCGQMMVARRDAYDRIKGHQSIRQSMHDGIMLPRAFRAAGLMTDIFDASRFASCRMYGDTASLFEGLLKNATEGMAKPVALPVWTILLGFGHVLPVFLLMISPGWLTATPVLLSLGARAVLALRFRAPWWSVVVHPLAIGVLLALQWIALFRQWRGRPATWRGRAYAP